MHGEGGRLMRTLESGAVSGFRPPIRKQCKSVRQSVKIELSAGSSRTTCHAYAYAGYVFVWASPGSVNPSSREGARGVGSAAAVCVF